jgi:diaminohydroxyphosphoribosylaminopyrimidine deaminase / 5-amino-6-(5-phosphoribosylamino)uracil reductase
MTLNEYDLPLMERAVLEGRKGHPSPNPHVGAVVAKEDTVISVGHHESAGEEHAEIMAMRLAGDDAKGATLYVTLEPCNHTGRTPPCTEAVLAAGISRVVVGVKDPNPHVEGCGTERLRAEGIEVIVLNDFAPTLELIAPWSKFILRGMPYVSLKLAASLDGRIATRSGASRWVTGQEARTKVHELRATRDAVAVGIGTALTDDPLLTVRHVPGSSPMRVVFDTQLRLPAKSKLVTSLNEAPVVVVTSLEAPESAEQILVDAGVKVIRIPVSAGGRLDMNQAFRALAQFGVVSMLIEGGAELTGSLLASRLPDELHMFIAPILLGPRGRPGAVDWAGPELPSEAPRIRIPHWELCGRDAYVWGPIEYPSP